jgi:hypothetical protein
MVDPGTPENPHDKKFVPAFIDFIAVGIFGVAIHQLVHNEYSSGIALAGISILLFVLSFYWRWLATPATRLPSRMSQTALSAALDFRSWVGITLLIAGYFVVFPFLGPREVVFPPNVLLLGGGGTYEGTPLGIMWQSANLRTVSASTPQGSGNRILSFTISGKNVGAQEVLLQEGFIISLIDGERISMKVNTNPFPDMNISEAAPVPANAFIEFTAPFGTSGLVAYRKKSF